MTLKIRILEYILKKDYTVLDVFMIMIMNYTIFYKHYILGLLLSIVIIIVYVFEDISRKLLRTYKIIGRFKWEK